MAIIKRLRKSGLRFQVRLQGPDRYWITETFSTRREAEAREAELKLQQASGFKFSPVSRQLTVREYFKIWHRDTAGGRASDGWRTSQIQMFATYIEPLIGGMKLQSVNPAMIARILQNMSKSWRSGQTCRHVFHLLKRLFQDAVDLHEVGIRNPVRRDLKPRLIEKESAFMSLNDVKSLLNHVRGKPYEVAVWLGVYVGLRIGEIQALHWSDVDFEGRSILIRRTYVRKEKLFRDYPKGKRWHRVTIPPELLELLRKERSNAISVFVLTSPRRAFLCYDTYLKRLKSYCVELGIKSIATHTLRHTTSSVWMEFGATDEDMQQLFAHSDPKVTAKYIHHPGSMKLNRVAQIIRLFGETKSEHFDNASPNLPQRAVETLDEGTKSVLTTEKQDSLFRTERCESG